MDIILSAVPLSLFSLGAQKSDGHSSDFYIDIHKVACVLMWSSLLYTLSRFREMRNASMKNARRRVET